MGLDVSHDAFSGAYSAFNRFRQAVGQLVGVKFPPHNDPDLDDEYMYLPDDTPVGLRCFFEMSDCDGEISPEICALLAEEMERLVLPNIAATGIGGGHIDRDGGIEEVCRRWIRGCKSAAEANEPLVFG